MQLNELRPRILPVSLNERYYDLETLRKLTVDPFTKESFTPVEIQSARELMNQMGQFIERVKARIAHEVASSIKLQ